MARIERTPLSREDVLEILLYYWPSSTQAARRVHRAIDETLQFLSRNPRAGQACEELAPNLRSFPVSRYRKYLIFYRPLTDGIQVIRGIARRPRPAPALARALRPTRRGEPI